MGTHKHHKHLPQSVQTAAIPRYLLSSSSLTTWLLSAATWSTWLLLDPETGIPCLRPSSSSFPETALQLVPFSPPSARNLVTHFKSCLRPLPRWRSLSRTHRCVGDEATKHSVLLSLSPAAIRQSPGEPPNGPLPSRKRWLPAALTAKQKSPTCRQPSTLLIPGPAVGAQRPPQEILRLSLFLRQRPVQVITASLTYMAKAPRATPPTALRSTSCGIMLPM